MAEASKGQPEKFLVQTKEFQKIRNDVEKILAKKEPLYQKPDFDMGNVFHPHNLLFTNHRREMYYAFEYGGALALSEYMYEYGRQKELAGNNMFKYFHEDKTSVNPDLALILSTIHPEVVKSLILNNVSYRKARDPEFEAILNQTTNLENTIGIYFCQWGDLGTDPMAQTQSSIDRSAHRGKGLSKNQWRHLKEKIRQYKQPGTQYQDYVKKVDFKIVPVTTKDYDKPPNDPDWRRYAQNDNQRKVLERFCEAIDTFENLPAHDPNVNLDDEPMHWGPVCVGFGRQVFARVIDHTPNLATSALFGAVNAIIKTEFEGQFQNYQCQILYLTHPDHRNLGEAAISVLCNSYAEDLGLNGKHGGAIGIALKPSEARTNEENIERLFKGDRRPNNTRGRIEDNKKARGWRASRESHENKLDKIQEWWDNQSYPIDRTRRDQAKEAVELEEKLNDCEKLALAADTALGLGRIRRKVAELKASDPRFQKQDTTTEADSDEEA